LLTADDACADVDRNRQLAALTWTSTNASRPYRVAWSCSTFTSAGRSAATISSTASAPAAIRLEQLILRDDESSLRSSGPRRLREPRQGARASRRRSRLGRTEMAAARPPRTPSRSPPDRYSARQHTLRRRRRLAFGDHVEAGWVPASASYKRPRCDDAACARSASAASGSAACRTSMIRRVAPRSSRGRSADGNADCGLRIADCRLDPDADSDLDAVMRTPLRGAPPAVEIEPAARAFRLASPQSIAARRLSECLRRPTPPHLR